MSYTIKEGQTVKRNAFIKKLINIRYERNDVDFSRGKFRVRGDTVELVPVYEEAHAYRIEFFGDEIDRISLLIPSQVELFLGKRKLLFFLEAILLQVQKSQRLP